MPAASPIRRRAALGLVAYGAVLAVVGLWPTPVDRPLGALDRFGVRPIDAYGVLEFTANVAFFVTPALLLVLVVGLRRWWLGPLAGLLCSVAIELAQHALLPARLGTVNDVIANTLGALIGTGLGTLVLARLRADARDPLSS
jgi:hypothetical protein